MSPYIPNELPIEDIDYKRLFKLMGQTNAKIAEYNGLLQGIVNPNVMLSPLTNQEAVLSSKIEGTQATIDEVLEYDAGIKKEGEKQKDIQEIRNYRHALLAAKKYLRDRPITLILIKEIHKILLDSVRGRNKSPGEFRTDQNWIGSPGCTIEEASFVSPDPLVLLEYLDKWKKYIDSKEEEVLLQTAVMHAQFELIHPFNDGNGRIGRILIPLFLYKKEMISASTFYLSQELESNRKEYYSKLKSISQNKDWNSWIEFFIRSLINQATRNIKTIRKIMFLYDETKEKIQEITHSQFTVDILDAIFSSPIFKASDLGKELENKINRTTTSNLLKKLKENDLLVELQASRGRSSAVLGFIDLIKLTK